MSIWVELKRRRVLRVAAAYIVVGWVLMQVASLLEETLELPSWFDKVAFSALLLGFPLSLLLSWAYDIHPDSRGTDMMPVRGRSVFIGIVTALLLVGSGYGYLALREAGTEIERSIAVLPFADLSPDADQSWFADGIAEEILNVLAKTEGLKVASRTASFRYRGDDVDLNTVAAELKVAAILEGSVRSQGDRVRITAQLINAEDGFHLWSETFDRQRGDIFAVQDEISVSIASALFGELGVEALPEHRFSGTRNVEAYNAYLRGLEKLNHWRNDVGAEAVPDFETAVALDPGFADAWTGLARARNYRNAVQRLPLEVGLPLKRALQLDSGNAYAIAELATANASLLRWLEAEQLYLRAIAIEPDNSGIRFSFGTFLRRTGRVSRGLEELLKARELGSEQLDLASRIINTHAYLGQFAEARALYEAELARVGQQNMRGNEAYFVSLLADGMEAEARAFAAQYISGGNTGTRMRFFLDRLDGNEGAGERLIASTQELVERRGFSLYSDAENFLLAGNIELARDIVAGMRFSVWSSPPRMSLFVDDSIDPRYLPYKANWLLIMDEFPGVPEAFEDIGIDLMSLALERGYLDDVDLQ
jgi:TolB-like protein/tetratricopeptide (TPR) repeat protein